MVFDRRVGQPEFINIGPGTAPETWQFTGNAWFDAGGERIPKLPGNQFNGVRQIDRP